MENFFEWVKVYKTLKRFRVDWRLLFLLTMKIMSIFMIMLKRGGISGDDTISVDMKRSNMNKGRCDTLSFTIVRVSSGYK